jgi:dUTP pyrophosphatase
MREKIITDAVQLLKRTLHPVSFSAILILMEHVVIKCALEGGAKLPTYQTAGAAGADIAACLTEPVVIPPGGFAAIPTGLYAEIPPGYEIQVRPRSGLAAKHGVTCLNTPGTIDSDYRGEIKVLLINHGKEPFTVKNGERIAQLVAAPVAQAFFTAIGALSHTERAEGGFGSTGT